MKYLQSDIEKVIREFRNIGPKTAPFFAKAGMTELEELKKLGTEEVYLQLWEKNHGQIMLHPCMAYAIEGALTDTAWNKIPETRKKELNAFYKKLKNSI